MKSKLIILLTTFILSSLYVFPQKSSTENDSIFRMIPSLNPELDKIEIYETYAPLDSVPDWVKRKVTPDEYELWKKLSQYFLVDHTVLLNDELDAQQKEQLYDNIKNICKEVEEGTYDDPIHVKLTLNVLSFKARLPHKWNIIERTVIDEKFSYNKVKCLIYQSQKDKNAGLEITVWYTYNDITKYMNVIHFDLSPVNMQKSNESTQSNTFYRYHKPEKKFYGSCSGIISYIYNGETINEPYKTDFTFYPDKIERWLETGVDF